MHAGRQAERALGSECSHRARVRAAVPLPTGTGFIVPGPYTGGKQPPSLPGKPLPRQPPETAAHEPSPCSRPLGDYSSQHASRPGLP